MTELLTAAERAQEDCTEIRSRWRAGTCEALLTTSAFLQWTQSTSGSAILWAHARPGSGKSVHASYLIRHLEDNGCICAYFFFKFMDSTKRSTKSLLSCIAFQMAQKIPEYRDNLVTLYRSGLRLDKVDLKMAWSKFILGAFAGITRTAPIYWVIDALDESDSPNNVIGLLSDISELQIPIRVFLTSRALPALENNLLQISSSPLLELSLDDNTSDIQSCVESELQPMIGDRTFKQKIATKVVLRAQGNFLWAHLAAQQLLQCHSAEEIEQALNSLPPGMDALYGRMEQHIASLNRAADQQLSHTILTWTVFARRPLTKDELLAILEPQFSRPLNFEHTLSEICGHFVLINATNKVTLIHHTAREYLTKAEKLPFSLQPANAHELLFERSIGVFMDPSVRSTIRRNNMPQFGNYAATSWPYHLSSISGTLDGVLDILIKFFQDSQALTWIQSLAILKQLKVLIYASRHLTTFIAKRKKFDAHRMPLLHRISDLSLLECWAIDLLKIAGKFGVHLLEDPAAIHRIIPAFCPSHSMIHKSNKPHKLMLKIAGSSSTEWDDRVARVLVGANQRALTLLCRGCHLAVSTSAGTILVWDALTFNLVSKIDHDQHIFKMCFSNNGDRLAAYGLARTGIWQTTTGQQLHVVENPPEIRPLCMAFTAEDDRIIIASDTRKILELVVDPYRPSAGWDMRKSSIMEDTASISGAFINSPTAVAFSPDMTELAVAYRGFPLTVWSVDSAQPVSRCRRYTGVNQNIQKTWSGVNRICWHPTNGDLLGIYTDGMVFKWNPIEETHDELKAADINATPSEIDCSPEGTIFATSDVNGSIRLYDVQHFVLIYQLSSEDIVTALCFSSDGRRFYDLRGSYCDAWEPNVLLRLSDTDERAPDVETEAGSTVVSGSASEAFADAPTALTALIVDPDGATIFIGNEEGSVEVLDYNGESQQVVSSDDAQMCVDGLACADNGNCFVYTNLEGELILQRLQKIEGSKKTSSNSYKTASKGKLKSGLGSTKQLLFSHDSTTLLLVTQEFVQLWTSEEALALKKSMPTDSKAGTIWMAHPFQSDQLLSIESETICAHSWSSLEVLHQWSLIYPTTKDEEDHGKPNLSRASSSRNTLTAVVQANQTIEEVVISYNKRHMVFTLPGPETSKTFFFDTQAFDTGANTHSRTIDLKAPHSAISSQILRCLAVLEPDKLVFLNKSYWVCTWHLRDLERQAQAVIKHYFLPTDWVSKEGLKMCRMAKDGTLFLPRKGRVAVLRSSIAAEW